MTKAAKPLSIERILQNQGFGARKLCRILVRNGSVQVNGNLCEDPDEVFPTEGLTLEVEGVEGVWPFCDKAYILLNKPEGYECSRAPKHHPSVLALLADPLRARDVQPVGRLDVETTGLLLLTDDGQCIHVLTSPKHAVPKVYRATLAEAADQSLCDKLLAGVLLKDEEETIAADACRLIDPITLEMTITQGKYHQVRRMIAAAGNHVNALQRTAIGELVLPNDLAPGEWQWLNAEQMRKAGWTPR
ncbi:MAG: 16S rRNA pseudouridine(516) synthase [Fluviibacter sp.]